MKELKKELKESLFRFENTDEISAFVEYFRDFFEDNLLLVIFYGSCISRGTRKETSYPDFYVVVKSYKSALKKFRKKRNLYFLLSKILPPTVFFLKLEKNGKFYQCKFNLISKEHLDLYTSEGAPDTYIFGRFGKRIVLPYFSSEKEMEDLVLFHLRAVKMNAEMALHFLPVKFGLDEFIKKTLSISYMGDYRVERDTKIEEIFESEKNFYRRVYSLILDELEKEKKILKNSEGLYERISCSEIERKRAEKFLKRSRRRSVYRWPKGILTVGNYVDYLLSKLERARGIKIELTPLEKKYPLIFGWKHFFRIKREGHLK